jgi:tetratricopeptide (TPR) repeat protein
MAHMVMDRHPDAERLAAYVDGGLDTADRANVERHLADCADCRTIVAETVAFLGADGAAAASDAPFRWRRQLTWVAGLTAAALIILAVGFGGRGSVARFFGAPSGQAELEELVAALANEPARPVEGRLTALIYAPPPSPTRGPGDREPSPDVRIAAAKIEKLGKERDAPDTAAALGLAYLASANWDGAIASLENAVRQKPDDASFQNDLAAAYLARARAQNRPEDLSKALAAAERARQLRPDLVEAYFNRALALEELHRDAQADAAWVEYQSLERSSPWRAEAEQRLRALRSRR